MTATLTDREPEWVDTGSGPGYLRRAPTISLDPALRETAPRRPRANRDRLALGALAVIAALLGGMLLAQPTTTTPAGLRPLIMLSAVSLPLTVGADPGATVPTALVWYADGTRGSAGIALDQPWRPDRDVRMVTLVAAVSCSISIDERLVVDEGAAINRVAVCVWTAP